MVPPDRITVSGSERLCQYAALRSRIAVIWQINPKKEGNRETTVAAVAPLPVALSESVKRCCLFRLYNPEERGTCRIPVIVLGLFVLALGVPRERARS